MAKSAGMGDNFAVDGYNLSGDVASISAIGGGPAPLEMTGIDKLAYERVGGLRSARIEWVSYFNDATGQAHPALKSLPMSNRIVSYLRGTTLGSAMCSQVSKQVNYDPTRNADGSLTLGVQTLSTEYGQEWGRQLTAGFRADVTATNGTGVDFTTVQAGAYGAQAYLHLVAFTGTSVTVKIQSSSDNGAGDAWADVAGLAFTAATAIGTERIAVSGVTLERYLRVVTTGTFTVATFAVNLVRNEHATAVF